MIISTSSINTLTIVITISSLLTVTTTEKGISYSGISAKDQNEVNLLFRSARSVSAEETQTPDTITRINTEEVTEFAAVPTPESTIRPTVETTTEKTTISSTQSVTEQSTNMSAQHSLMETQKSGSNDMHLSYYHPIMMVSIIWNLN